MAITLEAMIEAILFWRAEPLAVAELARAVARGQDEVRAALTKLQSDLASRGVILVQKDDEVTLGSHPEASDLIEKLGREALSRDLGKASLETLTTVLYRGPISRAEIDYVRGVNSSFILRHLMTRGLVERVPNPADARGFLYRPTFDLLQHLGLGKVEDLPEYSDLSERLAHFATGSKQE